MRIYLDSADPRQWRLPAGAPPIQGVTTNPTLLRQAGWPVTLDTGRRLLREAGRQGLRELMLQLPRPNVAEARDWLGELAPAAAQAGVGLTIKLPCHPDWEPLIREVHDQDLPLLLTGLANPMQLLWARSQDARYVAPYLGRLEDAGRDVWPLVDACLALQEQGLRLLAASIRSAAVLSRLIAGGSHAATLRPELAAGWVTDPLTDQAIASFAAASEASLALHPAEPLHTTRAEAATG